MYRRKIRYIIIVKLEASARDLKGLKNKNLNEEVNNGFRFILLLVYRFYWQLFFLLLSITVVILKLVGMIEFQNLLFLIGNQHFDRIKIFVIFILDVLIIR
jgi:hypothetical protein